MGGTKNLRTRGDEEPPLDYTRGSQLTGVSEGRASAFDNDQDDDGALSQSAGTSKSSHVASTDVNKPTVVHDQPVSPSDASLDTDDRRCEGGPILSTEPNAANAEGGGPSGDQGPGKVVDQHGEVRSKGRSRRHASHTDAYFPSYR